MNVIHQIRLDMQQNSLRQTLHVKQGDSMSRTVSLALYNNGTAWEIPSDATILQLAYYKPDRTGGLYDTMPDNSTACIAAGNVVTARLHPQMFAVAGLVACELRLLTQSGAQISTFSWYMMVDAAVTNGITSEDYFNFATLDGLRGQIGDLTGLLTAEKSNLVAALNEVLKQSVRSVNGQTPAPSGAVTIAPEHIGVQIQTNQYQGTLAEALEELAEKTAMGTKSVNGVTPNSAGNVILDASNIPEQITFNNKQLSNVHEALEEVTQVVTDSAGGRVIDQSDDYAAWVGAGGDAYNPRNYIKTLPDGDYRIVASDCEYIYHKFTANSNVWIMETQYPDDVCTYLSFWCNDSCAMYFSNDDGIYLHNFETAIATQDYVDEKTKTDATLTKSDAPADAGAVGNAMNGLLDELDSEALTFTDGVYVTVNGNAVSSAAFKTTNPKPVIGGGKVRVRTMIYGNACICFYDSRDNLAGYHQSDYTYETVEAAEVTLDVPDNAAYIRVSAMAYYADSVRIRNLDLVSEIIRIRRKVDDDWKDVQNAVRLGVGANLYPVGYEFETLDADTGNRIVWVVRGHDHHTPADSHLSHSMTLEMKYVYSDTSGAYKNLQYDAAEALYYAQDGLAAGTYHFTVENQQWYTEDNGKSFQFTLTKAVPVGGQVCVSITHNETLEGKSVKTYANPSSTTVVETVTLTEGSEGTDLGTTNGAGNINHLHRIALGSNNYAQSAARQWLNSAAAAGGVWTPTNKFDRAPSWATTYNGFMHSLPADFLAVIEPAVIPCITNEVCECASLDGTEFTVNQVYELQDKFFLLSRPEIYGSWDSATYKDGELLDYYDGLTNAERKKYDNGGSARLAWLRSLNPSTAIGARIVNSDGSALSTSAHYGSGVAPACIIA